MGLILKIVGIFSIIIGIVAVFTIIGTIIQGIVLIAVGSIYDDVKYIKYFLEHK